MSSVFDIVKFCRDYDIPIAKSGKHVTKNWVNIKCPFCNGEDHLGVHVSSGAIKCWKCGTHSTYDVIKLTVTSDRDSILAIMEDYTTNKNRIYAHDSTDKRVKNINGTCVLPYGAAPLAERHRRYLEERGFDSYAIERIWGIRGTGNLGDYKFRIIAPVIIDGNMVSYQGRDITGKSELRYKACKQENEVIQHQTVVYGLDLIRNRRCVVVEGVVDAWRIGAGAVSCFGIAFSIQQVNLLAEYVDYAFILFDAEEQAQKQARELAVLLSARGVEVEILDISDTPLDMLVDPDKGIDPGNLKQEYADSVKKELEL